MFTLLPYDVLHFIRGSIFCLSLSFLPFKPFGTRRLSHTMMHSVHWHSRYCKRVLTLRLLLLVLTHQIFQSSQSGKMMVACSGRPATFTYVISQMVLMVQHSLFHNYLAYISQLFRRKLNLHYSLYVIIAALPN